MPVTHPVQKLVKKIDRLVRDAPTMSAEGFAKAALPLLMEASNALSKETDQ